MSADTHPSHGTASGGHVPVACFGERGMDHQPELPAHAPIAAGLFGMTMQDAAGAAGVAAIMARSPKKVPVA